MKTIKIPDNVRVGVTSDTHIHHRNILEYCLRPWVYFDTDNRRLMEEGKKPKISDDALRAHDETLIANINNILGEDDFLIHCGDVGWNGIERLREFYEALNVSHVFIAIGNHDNEEDLKNVFGSHAVMERFQVEHLGRKAVIDHFPGHTWEASHKGTWLLYGHVHGKLWNRHLEKDEWLLSLDVGVDTHDYKPWLWKEELMPLFDSRYAKWKEWRDRTYSKHKTPGSMVPQSNLINPSIKEYRLDYYSEEEKEKMKKALENMPIHAPGVGHSY